jgi:hypothetical protein
MKLCRWPTVAYGYDDVMDKRRRVTVLIGFVDLELEEVES